MNFILSTSSTIELYNIWRQTTSSPSLAVVPCPPYHKNLANERSEDRASSGEKGGYGDHGVAEEKAKGNGVFFASLAILGVALTDPMWIIKFGKWTWAVFAAGVCGERIDSENCDQSILPFPIIICSGTPQRLGTKQSPLSHTLTEWLYSNSFTHLW